MVSSFCRSALILPLLCLTTASLRGQEAEKNASDWEALFRKSASRYKVVIDGTDRQLKLVKRPILNWSNPQRKTSAGALFIWADKGRPIAAMCIYPNEDAYDHEFQSLTSESLRVTEDDAIAWLPNEPGMVFSEVGADSAAPGRSPALRLRQMRNIARRFNAELGKEGESPRPLRLLTTPLYRYPKPDPDSLVIDGAVFGFVQGTDPEVLLIVEAITDPSSKEQSYQYGLARMSMVPMRVKLDQRNIWEKSWAQVRNAYGPYYTRQGVDRDSDASSSP